MNQGLFQLLRIINNMADAEQYLTGNQPYREPTSMGSFFGEILEKSGALMGKAGVQLLYTPPHREGIGNLDRQKMERAVYNLLSNALRFTPKGGTIRVCLTLEGERAVLRIQDSGDGLHREIQQDLFNRYRRTPAVEDSRFGLGLGLLLVRQTALAPWRRTAHQRSPRGRHHRVPVLPAEPAGHRRPPLPLAGLDYAGCWDHGLVELSRELPLEVYDPQNLN
ncbi:MAG: sensor histidine kinase [Oscillospiraceae bacterium]